jgi:hypothetical protein
MIFSEYFREQNPAFGDNRVKVSAERAQKAEDCENEDRPDHGKIR